LFSFGWIAAEAGTGDHTSEKIISGSDELAHAPGLRFARDGDRAEQLSAGTVSGMVLLDRIIQTIVVAT
jgi:hypothetical protein